jgi:hypothetical protein
MSAVPMILWLCYKTQPWHNKARLELLKLGFWLNLELVIQPEDGSGGNRIFEILDRYATLGFLFRKYWLNGYN